MKIKLAQTLIDEVIEDMEKKYNPDKQIFEIVKRRMKRESNE